MVEIIFSKFENLILIYFNFKSDLVSDYYLIFKVKFQLGRF